MRLNPHYKPSKPRRQSHLYGSLCNALAKTPQATENTEKSRNKRGQAAVEYILIVAFMTLIFGAVFTAIRQNLFNLWVCEMAPRIQSPVACSDGSDCLGYANDAQAQGLCY